MILPADNGRKIVFMAISGVFTPFTAKTKLLE
jgi:hypothetical protein